MNARVTMTGQKYGRLTVISEEKKKVLCTCDCGNKDWYYRGNVLAGYTQSCGCLQKEKAVLVNTSHGLSKTYIYERWKAMRRRCYSPSCTQYPWYGAKGIRVCERWQVFDNFYLDMFAGYKKGLTLGRKDHSKDYSPENCLWQTKSENSEWRGL